MDRLDLAARLQRAAALHRGAQQLVHPPLARALLEERARTPTSTAAYDTLYTVLVTHDARDGAVPAVPDRAHPPGARRTARACISQDWPDAAAFAVDAGAGRAHGSGPRGLLGRGLDPHGEEPPQPPAAGDAHHRASEPRDAWRRSTDVIAEEANVKEVVFADDPVGLRLGSAGRSIRASSASGSARR